MATNNVLSTNASSLTNNFIYYANSLYASLVNNNVFNGLNTYNQLVKINVGLEFSNGIQTEAFIPGVVTALTIPQANTLYAQLAAANTLLNTNLFSNSDIMPSLPLPSTDTPFGFATYWNFSESFGETDFYNFAQDGAGGYHFYTANTTAFTFLGSITPSYLTLTQPILFEDTTVQTTAFKPTGVTAGTYVNPQIQVNSDGLIEDIQNGGGSFITGTEANAQYLSLNDSEGVTTNYCNISTIFNGLIYSGNPAAGIVIGNRGTPNYCFLAYDYNNQNSYDFYNTTDAYGATEINGFIWNSMYDSSNLNIMTLDWNHGLRIYQLNQSLAFQISATGVLTFLDGSQMHSASFNNVPAPNDHGSITFPTTSTLLGTGTYVGSEPNSTSGFYNGSTYYVNYANAGPGGFNFSTVNSTASSFKNLIALTSTKFITYEPIQFPDGSQQSTAYIPTLPAISNVSTSTGTNSWTFAFPGDPTIYGNVFTWVLYSNTMDPLNIHTTSSGGITVSESVSNNTGNLNPILATGTALSQPCIIYDDTTGLNATVYVYTFRLTTSILGGVLCNGTAVGNYNFNTGTFTGCAVNIIATSYYTNTLMTMDCFCGN
jgi:hypothetical protein